MAEWTKEKGPDCYCGCPTWVEPKMGNDGAYLICIFHTKEAGASFPLPSCRPDNWPNLTQDEMQTFMDKGAAEAAARGAHDGSE